MQWMLLTLIVFFSQAAYSQNAPALLLASSLDKNVAVEEYWVSEKLDGVRAYWDGKKLISRGGTIFQTPDWFIADFPATPLDGELWIARGQFEKTVSIVRKQTPVDDEWRKIRYAVFELPNGQGTFTERLNQLQALVEKQQSPYLLLIPQQHINHPKDLQKLLAQVVKNGGEGLMLHRKDALYSTGRNGDLIKIKPYHDAEATVVAYREGKGKYQGMTGALVVRNRDGKEFAIGSGLSDKLRQNPPVIGTVVTYQYDGLTRKGLPRHARFLRIREEN